jgi:Condensation domain
LQRTIERFCYHPMDIATGPLLRTALVRLAERDHALVVALHHLITDGWSTGILARDISAFYRAIVSNAAPPANLPVLPVQYGDYAAWQRAALESGSFDEHRIYWKRQLDGPLPRLDFSRFAGPRREKGIGGYYPIKWPASLYKRIVAAGRNHDATVFMTVLSAYACAVHQITSQTDIIVGTDIATRRMSSLENLIGLFINQIPIRLRLSSSLTFSGLLRHARSTTLASYAHAELPFDGIVRSVNPKRSAGDTPILQIMFVYFNAPRHSLDLPDVQVEPIELNAMTSRFDLSLQLSGSDSGMRGYWIYSTAVFDQDAIARFSNRFELLLDRALANPDSSIDSLLAALETADDQENLLTARLQSRRQRSSRFAVTHHDPARNQ